MYRTTHPPPNTNPSTVEEIFADINGRRSGFLQAFFVDVDSVFALCNPEEEELCLYAYPNERWNVSPPHLQVPPDIPEPVLGINFVRDGMPRKAWLQFVAGHCDSWLLYLAFFFGCRLNRHERTRLFDLIDAQPTLYEQVTNRPSE
ncbi:unnamed protein product [Arabis nemorensis]|uniref:PHD finger protein ALFIN-LIKE n=1 Tax=Arabis nemorensis TaxID=586526 RepID=A0A565CI91_9BRAS|nr:unnamed protein product [Arabis nemorensis]